MAAGILSPWILVRSAEGEGKPVCALPIQVSGIILIKGNVPHLYVALESETGKTFRLIWLQEGIDLLRQFQYRKIAVTGCFIKEGLGPGMPAEIEIWEVMPEVP